MHPSDTLFDGRQFIHVVRDFRDVGQLLFLYRWRLRKEETFDQGQFLGHRHLFGFWRLRRFNGDAPETVSRPLSEPRCYRLASVVDVNVLWLMDGHSAEVRVEDHY